MIDIPTTLDPVNVMPSTPPWLTSAEPTSAPPLTMFTTPRGTPASTSTWYTRWPDNEPISDGLMMHVLPVTSATPAGPAVKCRRKVERPDHRPCPVRAHHVGGDLSLTETLHRGLEPVVLAHHMRVVADEIG